MILLSCNTVQSKDSKDSSVQEVQSVFQEKEPGFSMAARFGTSKIIEELEEEIVTFHIVVADTSSDYYSLRDRMLHLHESLGIPIDTMGRLYNP